MQRRLVLSLLLPSLLYFAASGLSTHRAAAMGFDYRPLPRPPAAEEPETPIEERIIRDRTIRDWNADDQFSDDRTIEDPTTDDRIGDETADNRIILIQSHVAVILPLQSSAFGRLAEQVRLGILTASNLESGTTLPIIVYSTTEDARLILEAYERAVSNGAQAVIGPLTRNGVSELARSGMISVPTIALNAPDADVILPRQNYVFGLQIESEARQVAKLAFSQGGRKALVVVGETALGRRISQAFISEWKSLRGDIADRFTYTTDATELTKLRDLLTKTAADIVFMSVNAPRARFIRPHLGTQLPIYATSLVYASNADRTELYDLNEVRFLDMPWLLEEDHPAVMAYLRPQIDSSSLDSERFYALGIDAFRITQALLQSPSFVPKIDGVTGTIRLDERQFFEHELTPAYFAYGKARLFTEEPVDSE